MAAPVLNFLLTAESAPAAAAAAAVEFFLLNPDTFVLSDDAGLLVSLCSAADVALLLELLFSCEATEWDSFGFELDEGEDSEGVGGTEGEVDEAVEAVEAGRGTALGADGGAPDDGRRCCCCCCPDGR